MQLTNRFSSFLFVLILGLASSIDAQVKTPDLPAEADAKINGDEVTTSPELKVPAAPLTGIATIKRLSELRRELKIAESSSRARIILPANQMFEESAPTEIDHLAIPVLMKIAEYLRLTDKRKMTLTSYYLPNEDRDRSIAQHRTISLLQWFETTGELPTNVLQSELPSPIGIEAADKGRQNRIEINLEWEQIARAAE